MAKHLPIAFGPVKTFKLYFFEDGLGKRIAFESVFALLRKAAERVGCLIEDVLGPAYRTGLEKDARAIANIASFALCDPDALILLDLNLVPESYSEAGSLLLTEFRDSVDDLEQRVFNTLGELPTFRDSDQLYFAAVVLTLAHALNRPLRVASSGRRRNPNSQILSEDIFLHFPDSATDIVNVGAAAREIADFCGIDAGVELGEFTRANRVALLGYSVRNLLEALADPKLDENRFQQFRPRVQALWSAHLEESHLIAPELVQAVFSSQLGLTIRKSLESSSPVAAVTLFAAAKVLLTRALFAVGRWTASAHLRNALNEAGIERKILLFGDSRDRLFLDTLGVVCGLSGLEVEILATDSIFAIPNGSVACVLFWSANCQKATVRNWLVVLNEEMSRGRMIPFLLLERNAIEVAFCTYLVDCGAALVNSETEPVSWSPAFSPKVISEAEPLAVEWANALVHGEKERLLYKGLLHRIFPWLTTNS